MNFLRLLVRNNNYLRRTLRHGVQIRNCFKFGKLAAPGVILGGTTFINHHHHDKKLRGISQRSSDIEEDVLNSLFDDNAPDVQLLELMEILKNCILESCAQYRMCLMQQTEIIKLSMQNGTYTEYLDELPEYRILASELSQEFNNYVILLKTVGEMTFQHLNISVRENAPKKNFDSISEKYKALEMILQKQLDENRQCERELNDANRKLILQTEPRNLAYD